MVPSHRACGFAQALLSFRHMDGIHLRFGFSTPRPVGGETKSWRGTRPTPQREAKV